VTVVPPVIVTVPAAPGADCPAPMKSPAVPVAGAQEASPAKIGAPAGGQAA
jgi:hypothetical protein